VYVACSTLCFGRHSLEDALARIAELGFNKFDVAVYEQGKHLRPSEIVRDINRAVSRLRANTGLTPIAFSVEIDAPDAEQYHVQFKAICRLARLSATPLVTVATAETGSSVDEEVARLAKMKAIADGDGILLAIDTRVGTLAESPQLAVELCTRLPGLALTLDPSHYLVGPAQGEFDEVYPHVRHLHLRDTGSTAQQFQVRVGQGHVEYGKILSHLTKFGYDRALTVDLHDIPDAPFAMAPEVRKLKYLLESLV
jgi:sugar phosphate isomerase/epimerase